ncbi:MAG: ATP-binding protein [Planctomycetota bacterium]|nr:ATP-binding protein [Planctomycetota bacterium]
MLRPHFHPQQDAGGTAGAAHHGKCSLVNEAAPIEVMQTDIMNAMERFGFAKAARFAVRLAVQEAIANAFHHGHEKLPPGLPIEVEYSIDDARVLITVKDQGPGFTPGEVPDPTLDENLEVPSGRGLMLIRAYMTEVRHNERGNMVEMIFKKPAE